MHFGWRHSTNCIFMSFFGSWIWLNILVVIICLFSKCVFMMDEEERKINASFASKVYYIVILRSKLLSFVLLITIISDFNYLKLNVSNRLVNLFLLPSTFFRVASCCRSAENGSRSSSTYHGNWSDEAWCSLGMMQRGNAGGKDLQYALWQSTSTKNRYRST